MGRRTGKEVFLLEEGWLFSPIDNDGSKQNGYLSQRSDRLKLKNWPKVKKFCADRKPRVELHFDSPVLGFPKVKSRLFLSFPFKRYFLASLKNAWLYIFIRKKLLALHWHNIKLEYLTCMWPLVSSHYILGIIYVYNHFWSTSSNRFVHLRFGFGVFLEAFSQKQECLRLVIKLMQTSTKSGGRRYLAFHRSEELALLTRVIANAE